MAVTKFQDFPLADEDRNWDADAAVARIRRWAGGPDKENIDWTKYAKGFMWYDEEDRENFSSYKLPYVDIINGRPMAVPRAIYAIAGGRGYQVADIPEEDKEAIKRHLARYYKKMGKEPPWEREEAKKEVPFAKVDTSRQIVYGIVLDPYAVDAQNDWVPVIEVEKAAHEYLSKSRQIKDQHQRPTDAEVVESSIIPYPTVDDYRKAVEGEPHKIYRFKFGDDYVHSGAWVIGVHVKSEQAWNDVVTGKKTGFSIGAKGVRIRDVNMELPDVEIVEPDQVPVG